MNLKKKLTPWVILILSFGYIHAYDHNSQVSLLVYYLRAFTELILLVYSTALVESVDAGAEWSYMVEFTCKFNFFKVIVLE